MPFEFCPAGAGSAIGASLELWGDALRALLVLWLFVSTAQWFANHYFIGFFFIFSHVAHERKQVNGRGKSESGKN